MNPNFVPIAGLVTNNVDPEILNNQDVAMLFYLCLLLQEGPKTRNQQLLNWFARKVGVVTAARWVTTASNILIHYMQEQQPSPVLQILAGNFACFFKMYKVMNMYKVYHHMLGHVKYAEF